MDERLLTVTRPELLSEAQDTAFRAMLYDFFAFGSTLETARTGFASYVGLTPTQYFSLIVIARADPKAPVGVNQVAARLHLSGAFVTNEINKLVQEGLVDKRPHPTDGRRVQLVATKAGWEKLTHLAAFQRPVNDALFETLTEEEFRQLGAIMRRLAEGGPRALQLAKYYEGKSPGAGA
ncbi:MarR family winged helix-turn-helix transcriptional regulator [Bosea sp. BK604]|uniref:MarR family winged helix-turn-helix transcriptional regulator n=1 Tax=Bosea sp. BK604 TaxID=2512180 RepID=UPI0010478874|nr:MarR family winged helix-turn-helix transcriptional regulator [Bosea sp. BK604]TCR62957.1 MarR family transcriptional regulator [Bosea sp. BK604]